MATPANNYLVDEFKGTDDLYCAEVLLDDDDTGYAAGAVFKLAPVAEISKTSEVNTDTKYYDNVPATVIIAQGPDTVTLTVPALPLDILAYITGKEIDSDTGALMGGEVKRRYFALGYRLGLSDGTYRYVWRYKGTFNIPDEASTTKNNTTDTNNQSLVYTAISTTHTFTKPDAPQRELIVDERDGKADLDNFFASVTTCDTLQAATPAATYSITNTLTKCSNSNTATSISGGRQYAAVLAADSGYTLGTITVTMGGTDISSTAVSGALIIIGAVTGNLVITCTASA